MNDKLTYKVVEEFELNGEVKVVGSEIELTDDEANELGPKVEVIVKEGTENE